MSPDSAIERILSAEAQIKRREAAEDSPAFHNLTGAIVACGKALDLLSKLKAPKRNSLDLDIERHSMNTDFRVGDVVRHKSGGQDTIILRFENESVAGVTKKLAVCGRFEGQNFHQEIIPVEMLEFVNRWLAAGS